MGGYAESATSAAIKGSRINSDVERVLSLVRSVLDARDKVHRHTSALGYFSDTPQTVGDGGKVQPISSTMQNAIGDLDRAIDSLHGALALFE